MGILFHLNKNFFFLESSKFENCSCFFGTILLGCVTNFFVMSNIIMKKKGVYDFGFISCNYLFKNIFKFAIYGVAAFVLLISSGFISLITGKNYINRVFDSIIVKYSKKNFIIL